MASFSIEQIASKEIFIDIKGKEWMVSGFSDDDNNDWYNIYDYEKLSNGEDWIARFDASYPETKVVSMFKGNKNSQPMLTVQDLYNLLLQGNFKKQTFGLKFI